MMRAEKKVSEAAVMYAEKIAAIEKELAVLKRKEAKHGALPEDKRLATKLHDKLCKCEHTLACDWYYDDGSWSRYARVMYLSKARHLLANCTALEISLEDALELVYLGGS